MLYLTTLNRIWRATDGGDSWSSWQAPEIAGADRGELAVTPAAPDQVYAVFGSGATGLQAFCRSTDAGRTFAVVSTSPNILGKDPLGLDPGSQASYDLTIAAAPGHPSRVLVGGINVWKTENGGTTWSLATYWDKRTPIPGVSYVHADQHWLEFLGDDLYSGNDGGLYRSPDSGRTWSDLSAGLGITQFYRLATPSAAGQSLYAGSQDNGINRMKPFVETMTHCLGGDGMECLVDPNSGQFAYASQQNGNLWRSSGGGEFMPWIVAGAPYPDPGAWVTPLLMDRIISNRVFVGYGEIWRTDNARSLFPTWTSLGRPKSGYVPSALARSNDVFEVDILYVGYGSNVYRTDDALANEPAAWSDVSDGIPLSNPGSGLGALTVDPRDADRVYVGLRGYDHGDRVYRSSNGGDTWSNWSGTLPQVPVTALVADNTDRHGVYVGTVLGVWYRDNTLQDWIPFRNGLPVVRVTDLEVSEADGLLYAATYGRGIWASETYAPCPVSYVLTPAGDPGAGSQYYEASNSIQSNRVVAGGVGVDVTYQAGTEVRLTDGFEVRDNSDFRATLAPCSDRAPLRPADGPRGLLVGPLPKTGGTSRH